MAHTDVGDELQLAPHIVSHPERRGGKPTVDRVTITVDLIAQWYLETGMPVSEIVLEYGLTEAEVHAALAYFYDHRAEIEERRAQDEAWFQAFKVENPGLQLPSRNTR